MKSQSTIIGRVTPEFAPASSHFWKDLKYWLRYNSETLVIVSIVLFVMTLFTGGCLLYTYNEMSKAHRDAKLYHYAVGSNVRCNMDGDRNTDFSGWQPCKVVSVSKDNVYYTTSFYDTTTHKNETFKFLNQDIGSK